MLHAILTLLLFVLALIGMEGFAYGLHRFVMHGPLWVIHRSHHREHQAPIELNDVFAVLFAAPAILAIYLGCHGMPLLLPVGWGITAYGLIYVVFHDGMVHRRLPVALKPRSALLRRLVQAHRIHHALHSRDGCVSFGFLWAPPIRHLKRILGRGRMSPAE